MPTTSKRQGRATRATQPAIPASAEDMTATPTAEPTAETPGAELEQAFTPGQALLVPFADDLARANGNLAQLRSLLETLRAQRDTIEAQHAAAARRSPLALRLEVVGCRLAVEQWPDVADERNIPVFSWPDARCPFGKTVPDQDCRDCVHHKVLALGMEMEPHTRRYLQTGTVIPLTEDQATLLAKYLAALGAPALRRVDAEIAAVERAVAGAEIAQRHAEARALEAQQRGQAS